RVGYNPKTLAAETTIIDKRPLYWVAGLIVLAIAPLLGSNSLLSSAVVFAIYASINIVWMLIISTAGIWSLATLAIVGVAAYGTAYLSIAFGLPWWGMIAVGPAFGFVCGVVIAIPAIRLEGWYYALLTVGLAELCRVYVIQSRTFGAATGGLYGADTYIPNNVSERTGLVISYCAAFVLMLAALALYRLVNGRRLGRLLRAAPERSEAFAEALGVNYRAARIQVFLISSAALGLIGGFYATYFTGASPSMFDMNNLMLLLAMIVIGGIGTTEGAVVGTLIVVLFDQVFLGLGPLRLIIVAGIMLGTVLFTRGGLFGLPAQFEAWQSRRRSERRAQHRGRGGEIMPDEAAEIRDKQTIYLKRFDETVRANLRSLVTDELIAAHRRNPSGPHNDAMERLLNYFRRAAISDKYAILTIRAFKEYRIVALSGKRGVPPRVVDDNTYATPDEAQHAVFLRRVHDLMQS
ncbi:MAG: branched-chain amino acid ABC transporter permease, partial [Acetobacteraceae bacterium]